MTPKKNKLSAKPSFDAVRGEVRKSTLTVAAGVLATATSLIAPFGILTVGLLALGILATVGGYRGLKRANARMAAGVKKNDANTGNSGSAKPPSGPSR